MIYPTITTYHNYWLKVDIFYTKSHFDYYIHGFKIHKRLKKVYKDNFLVYNEKTYSFFYIYTQSYL